MTAPTCTYRAPSGCPTEDVCALHHCTQNHCYCPRLVDNTRDSADLEADELRWKLRIATIALDEVVRFARNNHAKASARVDWMARAAGNALKRLSKP